MKKFLLLVFFLSALVSCGKKKEIITHGTESWPENNVEFITEVYLDHDSAFNTWTDKNSGRLFLIKKSASLQDLKDSTYTAVFYYDNGNILAIRSFNKKIPSGNWEKNYPDGKKKSLSKYKDGKLVEITAWWENGNVNIEMKSDKNGKMMHHEFFENGNLAQQLEIDSTGSGSCVNYYPNGKKKIEGSVYRKNPSGIWKMYDTLGNLRQDTLFGIK
jgi:antitoxin component YwqK of YwqJK toxin-antitoxin module